MTPRKYLVLAGVILFGAAGDSVLKQGMTFVGSIPLQRLSGIFLVVLNPWIALGIFFLLGFFALYMTALSWADLTYVLPATSLGYVLLALIAKFFLHEQVTLTRWLGILLIAAGVGFVTQGPALTKQASAELPKEDSREKETVSAGAER